MIADTITKMIGEAMKARDPIRLSTLQLLSSALNYEFIAKQHKLSEEEEVVVVKKEAKKRKEAIEAYQAVKAFDRADKEKAELAILQEFMPPEMGDEELIKIVDETLTQFDKPTLAEMGRIIGAVMGKVKGQVDGNRVAGLVKEKLSS